MAAPKKYSHGLAKLIVDHIEDGMTISEICRKYPDMISSSMKPESAERQVHRWRKQYPEFGKDVDKAYQTLLIKQIDEAQDLSKELLTLDSKLVELQKQIQESNNENEIKNLLACAKIENIRTRERRDNIRVRLDTIKFNLAKLAPKMVPELKDQPSSVIALPTIQIVNYSDAENNKQKTIESN